MKQSIQSDTHKNNSICCLSWSLNGNQLFSADVSGLIMRTTVDFENVFIFFNFNFLNFR